MVILLWYFIMVKITIWSFYYSTITIVYHMIQKHYSIEYFYYNILQCFFHVGHPNAYPNPPADPSMPSECHLQSLFLSQNYLSSEIQDQEVHGCTPTDEPVETEVHIIRLWSSGSGLCGSVQLSSHKLYIYIYLTH